ncbi:hypothetical protein GUJ93_ZPchr0002g24061 [Zizania palustris]|uniref:Uncharacterized protein n=1 Tax=Zizania palustris TaxID=103762 RepID=A0A8J5VUP8_ZIZPA|nr:hypothetical protein GUJ93_ZPchr0002g24061 [Zizania palustris]
MLTNNSDWSGREGKGSRSMTTVKAGLAVATGHPRDAWGWRGHTDAAGAYGGLMDVRGLRKRQGFEGSHGCYGGCGGLMEVWGL